MFYEPRCGPLEAAGSVATIWCCRHSRQLTLRIPIGMLNEPRFNPEGTSGVLFLWVAPLALVAESQTSFFSSFEMWSALRMAVRNYAKGGIIGCGHNTFDNFTVRNTATILCIVTRPMVAIPPKYRCDQGALAESCLDEQLMT